MPEVGLAGKVCTYQEACQLRRLYGDGPLHCENIAELNGIARMITASADAAMLEGYSQIVEEIDESHDGCAQPVEVHQRAGQVKTLIKQAKG